MRCEDCGEENPADIHTCSPIRNAFLRMADQAKLTPVLEMFEDEVMHFATLVAAFEREQCALTCENLEAPVQYRSESVWDLASLDCADAIRKR